VTIPGALDRHQIVTRRHRIVTDTVVGIGAVTQGVVAVTVGDDERSF